MLADSHMDNVQGLFSTHSLPPSISSSIFFTFCFKRASICKHKSFGSEGRGWSRMLVLFRAIWCKCPSFARGSVRELEIKLKHQFNAVTKDKNTSNIMIQYNNMNIAKRKVSLVSSEKQA